MILDDLPSLFSCSAVHRIIDILEQIGLPRLDRQGFDSICYHESQAG
jgi:hypothetical protein